jgi:hypothetical protein
VIERAKRVFAAAAVIIVGTAAAVGTALLAANAGDQQPFTCAEFRRLLPRIARMERGSFMVATKDGFSPPSAVSTAAGDFLLGECAGGECVIAASGCSARLAYRYTVSGAHGGWRLLKIESPLYFGRGWQQLAVDDPSNVMFWRGWKEARGDCLASLAPAVCESLLGDISPCWKRLDGFRCNRGLLYGPGLGGVNADGSDATCSVGATDAWAPCNDEGHGPAWAEGVTDQDFWANEELDL